MAAALCAELLKNGQPPRFAILISGFGKPIPEGEHFWNCNFKKCLLVLYTLTCFLLTCLNAFRDTTMLWAGTSQ